MVGIIAGFLVIVWGLLAAGCTLRVQKPFKLPRVPIDASSYLTLSEERDPMFIPILTLSIEVLSNESG